MANVNEQEFAALRADYDLKCILAMRLLISLKEQVSTVVEDNDIALAVPIEIRVKKWESVRDKIERKPDKKHDLDAITDLAGLRIITMFQNDVEKLDVLLKSMLDISESEDTASRLDEAQFGYRSNHYIGRIPASWEDIPSFRGLCAIPAEIQVRTLPQHMWAVASHKLQYKREDSAPPRLRRSINRVSAILETVDLEFTRMLVERDEYIKEQLDHIDENALLNVDSLAKILSSIFPPENISDTENYDDLLKDVFTLGINTSSDFRDAINRGKDAALKSEKSRVTQERSSKKVSPRVAKGVFFKHVGLAREALRATQGAMPKDSSYKAKADVLAGRRTRPVTQKPA